MEGCYVDFRLHYITNRDEVRMRFKKDSLLCSSREGIDDPMDDQAMLGQQLEQVSVYSCMSTTLYVI